MTRRITLPLRYEADFLDCAYLVKPVVSHHIAEGGIGSEPPQRGSEDEASLRTAVCMPKKR